MIFAACSMSVPSDSNPIIMFAFFKMSQTAQVSNSSAPSSFLIKFTLARSDVGADGDGSDAEVDGAKVDGADGDGADGAEVDGVDAYDGIDWVEDADEIDRVEADWHEALYDFMEFHVSSILTFKKYPHRIWNEKESESHRR